MDQARIEVGEVNIEDVRFFENKKFMWDNVIYETRAEAEAVKDKYEKDKFEVQLIEQNNKFFVYTRRVVTEVKVEGAAPV